jgi:hypothetical protein
LRRLTMTCSDEHFADSFWVSRTELWHGSATDMFSSLTATILRDESRDLGNRLLASDRARRSPSLPLRPESTGITRVERSHRDVLHIRGGKAVHHRLARESA